MRPPATTFECIESVAIREPQRIALVEDGRDWTYSHIYLNLVRFTRLLHRMGVQRGQRVAVSCPSLQFQLLLLIACENLGAVTAPFVAQGDSDAAHLFTLVDWVFCESPQALPQSARLCLVDEAFTREIAAINPHDTSPYPRISLELHETARLSRTSGSTGSARFITVSRQAQEFWTYIGADNSRYTRETRLLACGPMVMNVLYSRVCACLRLGAAVINVPAAQAAHQQFTHVWALPLRLADLLDALPAGYVAPHKVIVSSTGGFISRQLRERVRTVFGTDLFCGYGANEAPNICSDMDVTGTGPLGQGSDVRIVDEQGRDVPPGATGLVIARTPGIADGYVNDPQGTRAVFIDGWFRTSDLGALVAPRLLRLDGRVDDLLNAAGLKIPASRVEAQIRDLPGVADCVVLSIHLPHDSATVGVALVAQQGASQQAIADALGRALVLGAGAQAKLLFVDALPRLPGGKPDRMALHGMFRA